VFGVVAADVILRVQRIPAPATTSTPRRCDGASAGVRPTWHARSAQLGTTCVSLARSAETRWAAISWPNLNSTASKPSTHSVLMLRPRTPSYLRDRACGGTVGLARQESAHRVAVGVLPARNLRYMVIVCRLRSMIRTAPTAAPARLGGQVWEKRPVPAWAWAAMAGNPQASGPSARGRRYAADCSGLLLHVQWFPDRCQCARRSLAFAAGVTWVLGGRQAGCAVS
jgi:hypothetical protein